MSVATLHFASPLPDDRYTLTVSDRITDNAGNPLDGEFNGLFPSGNGVPTGTFVQDLGVKTLQAPIVTAVKLDPSTDTGIQGDENTNDTTPLFDGQVAAAGPVDGVEEGSQRRLLRPAQGNHLRRIGDGPLLPLERDPAGGQVRLERLQHASP